MNQSDPLLPIIVKATHSSQTISNFEPQKPVHEE